MTARNVVVDLFGPNTDRERTASKTPRRAATTCGGHDSNEIERERIIQDVLKRVGDNVDKQALREALEDSRLMDITEYGRVVHAEMEALLSCARSNANTRGATLYSTTFPCHNCAKHIVAAGIVRVVYIEPYPKSKAAEFHDDAIILGFSDRSDVVRFEPFVQVRSESQNDCVVMELGSLALRIRFNVHDPSGDDVLCTVVAGKSHQIQRSPSGICIATGARQKGFHLRVRPSRIR